MTARKLFEIRDKATFIPAVAILMEPQHQGESLLPPALKELHDKERFLLRRAGFGCERQSGWDFDVMLCRAEASGVQRNASYDPYAWGDRTFHVAHLHICKHWDELTSGDVIDVEYILGETKEPKQSERITSRYE